MHQQRGFFEKLFDLSFSSFITPQLVGVFYVLSLIGAAFVSLQSVLRALRWDGFVSSLGVLVVSVVGLLVYAIFLRIVLEFFLASVRTAENTRIMAEEVLARKSTGTESIN